jgi:hypothetical protein
MNNGEVEMKHARRLGVGKYKKIQSSLGPADRTCCGNNLEDLISKQEGSSTS